MKNRSVFPVVIVFLLITSASISAPLSQWKNAWPKTDFTKHTVPLDEIISGGPPKDGIPSIDHPQFERASKTKGLSDTEPVITLDYEGDIRAYPIRYLTYHEIVNATAGKTPILITYCPLCNTAIVFKALVKGTATKFGTTGKLRHSNLLMYDHQTESWWQQFTGKAIVGEMTGTELEFIPSRMESFALFKKRYPEGKVMIAPSFKRSYGKNPYVGYDTSQLPMFYKGTYKGKVPALQRVIAVKDKAWSLTFLREKKKIVDGDLTLTWVEGQNSAVDTRDITKGRDVGNVVVQKNNKDVVYVVTFAFAFLAIYPNSTITTEEDKSSEAPAKKRE